MKLSLLQINSSGTLVKSWQFFLTGQRLFSEVVDGHFTLPTKNATIHFQELHGLHPDGIVGNKTWGKAMQTGFAAVEDLRDDRSGENFPPPPRFSPLVNTKERQRIFGEFAFESRPLPTNPENIVITDNWAKENIVIVRVPQLRKIIGHDRVEFHRLAADQLKKLWADWEKAGLLSLVFTWNGSFVPRFIRGSRTILSNHAFGSAFDINAAFNPLGAMPPLVGQRGCVREVVSIANENLFYWGGHFSRRDGMHFEIAKIRRN
jgi:hypothetical protein